MNVGGDVVERCVQKIASNYQLISLLVVGSTAQGAHAPLDLDLCAIVREEVLDRARLRVCGTLVDLFVCGIQAVEETLAQYGTADKAPSWLKPQFNQLEAMFGESISGSGRLSIGIGGTGKDCNNQEIVGAQGADGQTYQYTQLDSALARFQAAYAKARADGQAVSLSWDSAASPDSAAPSDSYGSTSIEAFSNWYA